VWTRSAFLQGGVFGRENGYGGAEVLSWTLTACIEFSVSLSRFLSGVM
jgi:hypothetical protein